MVTPDYEARELFDTYGDDLNILCAVYTDDNHLALEADQISHFMHQKKRFYYRFPIVNLM